MSAITVCAHVESTENAEATAYVCDDCGTVTATVVSCSHCEGTGRVEAAWIDFFGRVRFDRPCPQKCFNGKVVTFL